MFDDDDGVAEIAQLKKRGNELVIVSLVKSDGRLVQHVHGADEARAELGRKADALRLSARERVGAAVEAEIIEPDVEHELQAVADFFQDSGRDLALLRREFYLAHEVERIANGHRRKVHDVHSVLFAAEEHVESLLAQARAVTGRTRLVAHKMLCAETVTVGACAVRRVE